MRVEVKDKKKKEALVKKNITKTSKRKQPNKFSKLDKEKLWKMKIKEKKVNKNKLWRIEKITNHKYGRGIKKVTGLSIKSEGDTQLTWETLSVINETVSGMVEKYLDSKNLKS